MYLSTRTKASSQQATVKKPCTTEVRSLCGITKLSAGTLFLLVTNDFTGLIDLHPWMRLHLHNLSADHDIRNEHQQDQVEPGREALPHL